MMARLDTLGLHALLARDLTTVLYSLAQLRHTPDPAWLQRYISASTASLPTCVGRELANSAWAFATLNIDPGEAWSSAFFQRSEPREVVRTFNTCSSIAMVLWAVARLQFTPPVFWMQHMLYHAQVMIRRFDVRSLGNMMWALGVLRYRPPVRWLGRYSQYAAKKLKEFHPVGFVNVLWAFNNIQSRPPERWLWYACKVMKPRLSEFGDRDLALCLYAMAHMRWVWFSVASVSARFRAFEYAFEALLTGCFRDKGSSGCHCRKF